jgi:hypothetical protein
VAGLLARLARLARPAIGLLRAIVPSLTGLDFPCGTERSRSVGGSGDEGDPLAVEETSWSTCPVTAVWVARQTGSVQRADGAPVGRSIAPLSFLCVLERRTGGGHVGSSVLDGRACQNYI